MEDAVIRHLGADTCAGQEGSAQWHDRPGCGIMWPGMSDHPARGLRRRRGLTAEYEILPHEEHIWDIYCPRNLETVLDFIDGFENLYSIGRQGGFSYGGTADCMDIGFRTAAHIVAARGKAAWRGIRNTFNRYSVID